MMLVDGIPVHFTRHAVERWQERVRPGLSMSTAGRELRRLAAKQGRIVGLAHTPPFPVTSEEGQTGWLVLSPDVWCPVHGMKVPTVFTRGTLSPARRAAANARHARARAAAHGRRREDRPGERVQPPEPSEWS